MLFNFFNVQLGKNSYAPRLRVIILMHLDVEILKFYLTDVCATRKKLGEEMELEEHIITSNDDILAKNLAIKSFVENAIVDESIDLFEGIKNLANDIEQEGQNNHAQTMKSRIEQSKFANDDVNDDFNIYETSHNFNLFQEHSIIRDSFMTIAGFSSSGKTTFATQMALDILNHNINTVLVVYSIDDSKSFIKKKMYKQLLDNNDNIDISTVSPLGNEILNYKSHINKNIMDRIHLFENVNLFSDINSIDIYRDLLAISNYHNNIANLKLIVIIDYMQILEHDNQNVREGLNRACKELKNIQKHFNCMLIALSQLSNEGNYRETSEIKNISDIIIKLYNEREYIEKVLKKTSMLNTAMNFIFAIEKNKAGIKGMVYKASINSNFSFAHFEQYDNKQFHLNSLDNSNSENNENSKYDSLGNRAKIIYNEHFYETDKFIVYKENEYSQNDYYIKKGYKTKSNKKEQYFIGKKMILPESKDFKKNQIWIAQ